MASSDASSRVHYRQRAKARQPIFTGLSMEDLENWLRQAVEYNSVCHFALKVWGLCRGCTVVFHYYIMSWTGSASPLSLLFIISNTAFVLVFSNTIQFPTSSGYVSFKTATGLWHARPSIPLQFKETFGSESATVIQQTSSNLQLGMKTLCFLIGSNCIWSPKWIGK